MARSHDNLTLSAARLARRAPQEWDAFLGDLSTYTNEQAANCIKSPLEELPRAQGRAQIALELNGILADCLKASNKIEERK